MNIAPIVSEGPAALWLCSPLVVFAGAAAVGVGLFSWHTHILLPAGPELGLRLPSLICHPEGLPGGRAGGARAAPALWFLSQLLSQLPAPLGSAGGTL